MNPIIIDGIEDYARRHTSAVDPLYEGLREETYRDLSLPQMQVGQLEGRFLKLLAQLTNARLAVEVGTFSGYSGLSIAEGLADDGKLITLDIDPVATAVARRYFATAPWGHKVELRLGDARAAVATIEGPIDLAFIDADKPSYIHYWDALVPKVRSGGLIVVDNVLWSGRVLDPTSESDRAIVAFNAHAAQDRRVEQVMLTVRDGLTVARKR